MTPNRVTPSGGIKRAGEILRRMHPIGYDYRMTVGDLVANGMQDAQYSPNMSMGDRMELRELANLIRDGRLNGRMQIREIMCNDGAYDYMALEAERSMYNVVLSNPDIKRWLVNFNPEEHDGFMWTYHPMLVKLGRLTDGDGHSGASFACTVRKVQEMLRR